MSNASGARPASILAIGLALTAVYVVWGSTYLAIRFALEGGYPPLLMAGSRFIAAGALMYAVLRLRGVPAPTRAQWPNVIAMGVLLLGLGNGMVCIAEQSVSSGMAAVAVASVPIWVALFSVMRGERPGPIEWAGLAIGFVGVLWLNAGSSLTSTPAGLVALLIAPLAWAFGSVWSRGRDLPSPFMAAAAQMLAGGVLILAAGLLLGERLDVPPTPKGHLALAYLASFGSIVGFTAYVWLLHNVRPTLASSYAYVNPAIAVVLGAWLAAERFTAHDLGAMAVILAAVVAITLGRARKAPAPVAAGDEA
ncbi:drug/metabolite exporter YedA [Luteimonas sp. S4-F44]|uniref:drug/metabolite exporter YedA n=1 Tax=Luteimonas sp. S4-F44 TaxID=2925842 RepID=UPI001F5341EE|nr:drug/metabolite exporter YedA [Luteimonas sp. S4-F44]UNK42961.1 drug/metabolite exporter YedA [Luteimonas sp. S4-F44]